MRKGGLGVEKGRETLEKWEEGKTLVMGVVLGWFMPDTYH